MKTEEMKQLQNLMGRKGVKQQDRMGGGTKHTTLKVMVKQIYQRVHMKSRKAMEVGGGVRSKLKLGAESRSDCINSLFQQDC